MPSEGKRYLKGNWSRRGFLARLGEGVALLGLSGDAGLPEKKRFRLEALAGAEGIRWEAVRRSFLLPKGLVYMNNGTLGPCPGYVIDETLKAWRVLEENPADEVFGPFLEKMEQVRKKAAEFLGCSAEEMALTHNTTDGMNLIAQGLHLKRGQRVLTTEHEHPGGLAGWEYYAQREGIAIDRVPLPGPPRDAHEILERIESHLTSDTRAISVSHVTFSTGLQMPIREIADLARARNILLVVDGAQAPGMLNVNVKALGCHAYATSAHKWMLAPKGTGLLYISSEVGREIDPLPLQHGRGVYTASRGTPNVPAILGLGAAMDFLNHLGKGRVEGRALQLRDRIYEGLLQLPAGRLLSPPPGPMASAMVTWALPEDLDSAAMAQRLKEKHRVIVKVVPPSLVNGLRISAHIYNSEEDVEKLLAALRECLKSSSNGPSERMGNAGPLLGKTKK